jgi:hypothetical protein
MEVEHRCWDFDTVQLEVRRRCYPMTVSLRVEACVDPEALQARFTFAGIGGLIGVATSDAERFRGETWEWSARAEGKGSRVREIRYSFMPR